VLKLLLLLLLALNGAWAQSSGQERLAEYERLSQEMTLRASRNAWEGVERAYQAMLETGIPPTAEEFHLGAQAAAKLGDVASTRARLILALEVFDSQEFRDWIHAIDTSYGPVSLKGDPGRVELLVDQLPFDPAKASAIQFAQDQIAETGSYEGLLPGGTYQFGQLSLKVRPGVHTQRIDIRSDKYMRKLERMERKEERSEDEE
jgi:hypothetical protein